MPNHKQASCWWYRVGVLAMAEAEVLEMIPRGPKAKGKLTARGFCSIVTTNGIVGESREWWLEILTVRQMQKWEAHELGMQFGNSFWIEIRRSKAKDEMKWASQDDLRRTSSQVEDGTNAKHRVLQLPNLFAAAISCLLISARPHCAVILSERDPEILGLEDWRPTRSRGAAALVSLNNNKHSPV